MDFIHIAERTSTSLLLLWTAHTSLHEAASNMRDVSVSGSVPSRIRPGTEFHGGSFAVWPPSLRQKRQRRCSSHALRFRDTDLGMHTKRTRSITDG